jgi:hypothetical protein
LDIQKQIVWQVADNAAVNHKLVDLVQVPHIWLQQVQVDVTDQHNV